MWFLISHLIVLMTIKKFNIFFKNFRQFRRVCENDFEN
jgi:hypothetical protein